ncbi:uncharacterized protein T551_01674 [Pneumocystis jirovecii RU7]|uniref:Uncharacterized protein n=1 Tax=Pneumocystis jirovecii (strain RU7) TaxID=1408657 RepID=A0A0W4ZPT2_PNEJ7|nr:uncharacterized protein T551_01674 [Pneumocystis jirovecii RU7]KTW30391.1 hypothetical protein T551_01674 [Pneumocystis jirovecii RU7]
MTLWRMKWTLNRSQNIVDIARCLRTSRCLFVYKNIRLYADTKAPHALKDISQPLVVSSFRGGFLGFFIGTSFATAAGYYFLINEYQHASNTFLLSIEELQRITDSIIESVKQIEEMEKNVKKLQNNVVTKSDIQDVRTDTKKMIESLNLADLEVNERLSELEMDVAKLSRYAHTIM